MEKKIRSHLKDQYNGIFLPSQIQSHINNYIKNSQSNYLIEKIKPLVKPGEKILDIGSGYGSFVLSALKAGYECFGIELENFEHKISKERASAQKINPVRFVHGSALNLPFKGETFDVITFWNVLEHVSSYKAAIKEAHRVLKPGGKMFIVAPNYFAFREEAHYHVPWLPLFPKPLARFYLKFLNRKTHFLDNCIHYLTIFGLKRFLKSQGLKISIDINEKIISNYHFQSQKAEFFVEVCKKFKLENIFMKLLFLIKTHPFVHSIDIIAKKCQKDS